MSVDHDAKVARWKRRYLMVLLGLMGMAAVGAIVGLMMVSGRGGDVIVVSAIGAGFLLLMAFCALPGMERPVTRALAFAGSGLALLLVFVLPVFMAYADMAGPRAPGGGDLLMAVVGSAVVIASLLCLASLVFAARLNSWGRIVQGTTVAAMLGASVLLIGAMWAPSAVTSDLGLLTFGMIILSAAGTLGVLVLNKFFATPVVNVLSAIDQTVRVRCPRCLKDQELPTGESACGACKLKFKIEIEEPLCPNCRYSLRGLIQPVCPECGLRLREGEGSGSEPAKVDGADSARLIGHLEVPHRE